IACSSDKKAAATTLNAPTLANADDQTYTVGTAIETLKFVNTGGDALTACASAPALPMGLAVAVSTPTPGVGTGTAGTVRDISCQITGTPTEATAEATYMITGTNATGMDAATVKITVEAAEEPVVTTVNEIADGIIIGPTGPVEPNYVVITTFEPNFQNPVNTSGTGITGEDISPKMTYTTDTATGEITVVVVDDVVDMNDDSALNGKFGFFTTKFNPPKAAGVAPTFADFTGYEMGIVKFDIESAAWGTYKAADGFLAKIDDWITNDDGFCACDQTIDASGWEDGKKYTVTLHVPSMNTTDPLDFTQIQTGIVIWPKPATQASATGAITFTVSNVSWEKTGGTAGTAPTSVEVTE
nr:hypothetical protein [Gammaproteobacteria bacterium]